MSLQLVGELFPNLHSLTLRGSNIPSMRDLGVSLRNLRCLIMPRCNLKDLNLSSLPLLEKLCVGNNCVSDVSGLAIHDQLRHLCISSNKLRDEDAILMTLSTLTALESVSLVDNPFLLGYRTAQEINVLRTRIREECGKLELQVLLEIADTPLNEAETEWSKFHCMHQNIIAPMNATASEVEAMGDNNAKSHQKSFAAVPQLYRQGSSQSRLGISRLDSSYTSRISTSESRDSFTSSFRTITSTIDLDKEDSSLEIRSTSSRGSLGGIESSLRQSLRPYSASLKDTPPIMVTEYNSSDSDDDTGGPEEIFHRSIMLRAGPTKAEVQGNPLEMMKQLDKDKDVSWFSEAVSSAGLRSPQFARLATNSRPVTAPVNLSREFAKAQTTSRQATRLLLLQPLPVNNAAASDPHLHDTVKMLNQQLPGSTNQLGSVETTKSMPSVQSGTVPIVGRSLPIRPRTAASAPRSQLPGMDSMAGRLVSPPASNSFTPIDPAVQSGERVQAIRPTPKVGVSPLGMVNIIVSKETTIQAPSTLSKVAGSLADSSTQNVQSVGTFSENSAQATGELVKVPKSKQPEKSSKHYSELSPDEIVALLRKKPKHVPEIHSRDAFRSFFHGIQKDLMTQYLYTAYTGAWDPETVNGRVARRLELLDGSFAHDLV